MGAERVLITAAPGGHSGYAYAIGYYIRELGGEPHFIAPPLGWLREKLSSIGPVHEAPLPRRPGEPLWRTLHRWPRALLAALRRVRGYDALVACGSNFSIPPAAAALLRRTPIYNVESIVRILDAAATPRILYRFSRATLLHWEEQRRHYPKGVVVGPIYEPPTEEPRDEGYVLVTAGTTGHPELFKAMLRLPFEKAVVQTGAVDPEPLRRRRPEWSFIRFTPHLSRLIARASLVITHFPGMTSATAALAYRKPVVLVPARHLRLSASLANMEAYARKIGAAIARSLKPEDLMEAVEEAKNVEKPEYPIGAREAARLVLDDP
jgi:UDP-N-acetylglucosamine--N-acetylmuramyl-(pentapeptide) pyrophosphoryl-undecaprenol N-acetylglucosamine transferase